MNVQYAKNKKITKIEKDINYNVDIAFISTVLIHGCREQILVLLVVPTSDLIYIFVFCPFFYY